MAREPIWRDASGRLTVDCADIDSVQFPSVYRELADAFSLTPLGEIVVAPSQLFWDFQRGEQVIGMDWDNWMNFMVVAKTPSAEPLVREIGAWLGSRVS